ncbi:hypothetical protein BSFP_055890 [Burkholderia stabilis]|uniref:Uncharacterized protein n=1 Tax=Burkholderia stabilis TaxID=95485 RepID=A0A1Y1BSG1_9BURK|nr:hypothetical protein BSFP_055890 [Burkholderia stabilis]
MSIGRVATARNTGNTCVSQPHRHVRLTWL